MVELAAEYGPKFILAIVVLIVGLRAIKWVSKLILVIFEKREVDPTLRPFVLNLLDWILKAMLFISVAAMIGIETTSFVAIVGALGLAVGFALQGTLGNFAGGVMLLLFKPYKVGDLIDVNGHLGEVEEIQIFVTKLITPDGKVKIIPNGSISNESCTNYSSFGTRRVDLTIGVSYSSDLKKAREVLLKVMNDHPLVLEEPAPLVGVLELADSAVSLAVRPWTNAENYWDVHFDILEFGKEALDREGISIPFPQQDVYVHSVK